MNPNAIKSCKEATRLMSEQLDHPLTIPQRILLKFHLTMCAGCLRFNRQVRLLKQICGQHEHPEDELPSPYTSTLSTETKDRIKSMLKD